MVKHGLLILLLSGAAQGLRWPWSSRRLARGTRRLATCCEGRTFVPATEAECPEDLAAPPSCDHPDLKDGDLCESDGACALLPPRIDDDSPASPPLARSRRSEIFLFPRAR